MSTKKILLSGLLFKAGHVTIKRTPDGFKQTVSEQAGLLQYPDATQLHSFLGVYQDRRYPDTVFLEYGRGEVLALKDVAVDYCLVSGCFTCEASGGEQYFVKALATVPIDI